MAKTVFPLDLLFYPKNVFVNLRLRSSSLSNGQTLVGEVIPLLPEEMSDNQTILTGLKLQGVDFDPYL